MYVARNINNDRSLFFITAMIDLGNTEIILASQSPRRQQLLKDMGFNFRVMHSEAEEIYPENLEIKQIPIYLAQLKANALKSFISENTILISADTIVAVDNEVLGKPKDEADAYRILKCISGRKHQVITGVCIKSFSNEISFFAESNVFFRELSDDEIYFYIRNYKPFDKAGAYGIQEWIGYIGIERIEGSYFNVMGLPTQMLYKQLNKFLKIQSDK